MNTALVADPLAPSNPLPADASPLGEVEEICIVTDDLERTATQMMRLGIGPWKVMEINPANTTEQTWRGKPAEYAIRVGFARVGRTIFELMQPLYGPSIFADFLRDRLGGRGEGLQHVAFDMRGVPWARRLKIFEERGFEPVQTGFWMNRVRIAFFDTEPAFGACFETYLYPPDYVEHPDDYTWFPHPPTRS